MVSQAVYRSHDPKAKEEVIAALMEIIVELSIDLRVDSELSLDDDTPEGIRKFLDDNVIISSKELDEMVHKARDDTTKRLGLINSRIAEVKELIALLNHEVLLPEMATKIRDVLRSALMHTALELNSALQMPNRKGAIAMRTKRLRIYSSSLLHGFLESSLHWTEFPFDVPKFGSIP